MQSQRCFDVCNLKVQMNMFSFMHIIIWSLVAPIVLDCDRYNLCRECRGCQNQWL